MLKISTKHIQTGEELNRDEVLGLIDLAQNLKRDRSAGRSHEYLKGKSLALYFDKPSLRTRFSFSVAMHDLGGFAIESAVSTRKTEEPEDVARVLEGYCQGIMVRTHFDQFITRMASVAQVPVINGLSQFHHPCQIFADLMTLKENFENLGGLEVSYIGDGNNILHSLLLLAAPLGIHVRYSCPKNYQPNSLILKKARKRACDFGSRIVQCANPQEAAKHAHAIYTDVWTSMGSENERSEREEAFTNYQVSEEIMALARKDAVFMHCLPMERGKEVSETLPDQKCSVVFQQSENRLHVQKALLVGLLGRQ